MRSTLFKSIARFMIVLGFVLFSSAAQAAEPDAWITTRTKLALFTSDAGNATRVHVDTINGRVFLYGKVATSAQKEKAATIAHKVSGVKGVKNLLEVVPEEEQKMVAASDDRIKEDIQKQLSADQSLADSHIAVKSVNNGSVLLSGDAASQSDHLHAVVCVADVPGVRKITSEVKAPEQIATYDAKPGKEDFKQGARDNWIVAASKFNFLADPDVPMMEIGVDASRNVVTLFGIVPFEKSREAAEADVMKVDATLTVVNNLQVVPSSERRLVNAKDEVVKLSVEKQLHSRKAFSNIAVEVKNGMVRLTGRVDASWQRLEAGMLARGTRGVRAVQMEITLQDGYSQADTAGARH